MYQVAACPTNKSHFVSCGDVYGEPAPNEGLDDQVVAKVETALRAYMKVPAEKDVRAVLKLADRMIVFVAIPSIGFTEVVVERLQKEFPTVTFFFLTGNQSAPALAIERKLLKVIVPQLHESEETLFNTNHQRLVTNVEASLDWSI
jgi:hypothetical protein